MSIPVLHKIKIIDNKPPTTGLVAFPLKVVCSCQWEALALDKESADYYVGWHKNSQARRGNIVEVESGDSGPVESVGEVREETPIEAIGVTDSTATTITTD